MNKVGCFTVSDIWEEERRNQGCEWWEVLDSTTAEKNLGVLVDSKVTMSPPCTPQAASSLDWVRNRTVSRTRDVIHPFFFSAELKPWLECGGSAPRSPLQQRSRLSEENSVKALEHLWTRRMREPWLFSPENWRHRRVVSMSVNSWVRGMKKREPENSQCYPVTESEVMGSSWNMRNLIKA